MNRYLLDHIPKTGGTALNSVFGTVLGVENVSPLIQFNRFSHVLAENDSFQLIQGHLRFMPGDRLPRNRLATTLLRDPIDRCLSTYFYYKMDANVSVGTEFNAINLTKSLSLAEYVNCEDPSVLELLDNFQSRHFFPLKWDGVSAPSNESLLAMARESLDEYDLVGIHELFDEFIDVLCYRWSWPLVDKVPRLKVTSSRPSKQDVKPDILKKLRALNELDIELYEVGKSLFEKARRTVIRESVARCFSTSVPTEATSNISLGNFKKITPEPPDFTSFMGANFGNKKVKIERAEIEGRISLGSKLFCSEIVDLTLFIDAREPIDNLTVGFSVIDEAGKLIFGTNSRLLGFILSIDKVGQFCIKFSFPMVLGIGGYWLSASLHRGNSHLEECYHWVDKLAFFEVVGKIGNHFEGNVCIQPAILIEEGQVREGLTVNSVAHEESWRHVTVHNTILSSPLASFRIPEPPKTMRPNEVVHMPIHVSNTGLEPWVSGGQRPVRFSYHWLRAGGQIVVFDGERTSLPWDIQPGETLHLGIIVKAPEQIGNFILRITLVQENGVWFDSVADSFLDVSVCVQMRSS